MKLFEFLKLLINKDKAVDFLIDRGVLLSQINCNNCGNVIYLNKETLVYRCHKVHVKKVKKKKPISLQCDFYKSARTGTCFARSHLDIITVCKLVVCFLFFPYPRQADTEAELRLSKRTIVNWFNFCREVCMFWAEKNSQRLGGPGHVVEIDEAKFDHRKYNRGRLIQGKWIFAGYERKSKKVFIMPVEERTEESLLACIKQWILPGTTIVSGCWKFYNCLNNENFQHLTISHGYNFVYPDNGSHSKHIERVWRDVRGNIPRYNTQSCHAFKYLAEFLFKRAYSREELIETFFDVSAELYPPMSITEFSLKSAVKSEKEENAE